MITLILILLFSVVQKEHIICCKESRARFLFRSKKYPYFEKHVAHLKIHVCFIHNSFKMFKGKNNKTSKLPVNLT